MFTGLQPRSWLRRNPAITSSVIAHLALLAVIVLRNPPAAQLTPTWLAWGDSTHTYQITYLPPGDDETRDDESRLSLPTAPRPAAARKKAQTRKPKPAEPPRQLEANAEEGSTNSKAGSLLGTFVDGPITGHDVRIAYPVYPEPQVDRADLPRDLVGDVIIEVTIDSLGDVIDTKILQAIGHGIDQKIEATLRRRHYQPAMLDGMPVPSHQDVHFHFPS